MKIADLRKLFDKELDCLYEIDEIRQHFAALCKVYFGYLPAEVVLHLQQDISPIDIQRFKDDLTKLKQNVPIQYIIGEVVFAGIRLAVNKSVLIPRPETEELIHWILTSLTEDKPLQVLDIGTGSGCIALALKKYRPNWHITAWDIDANALEVAYQNAKENDLHIEFHQIDVLSKNIPQKKWDIIVSNPPYVPEALKKTTHLHVLEQEPLHAIFVPDKKPLCFYERIGDYALQHLNPSGMLFFEGHSPLMNSIKILLQQAGFSDIVLQNDFRLNSRFIRASYHDNIRTN